MKQILLFVVFTVLSIAGFAQSSNRTMLRIRLSDNAPIAVEVNGRHFNKGTTSLTLDGLRSGLNRIEVFRVINQRGRLARMYSGTLRLNAGIAHVGVVDVQRRSLRLYKQPLDDGYRDDNRRNGRRNDGYDDYWERRPRASPAS